MPLGTTAMFASGVTAPATAAVRVLVADDHDVICAGVERLLAAQPDMAVCGAASSGTEALEMVKTLRPAVAILDVAMGGMDGLECARQIVKLGLGCEVLLFTGIETDELMREAFAAGAKSFILKSDARIHLLSAIRALALHKPYFTSKVSEVVFARLLRTDRHMDPDLQGRLSRQETELIRRLALGDSNREVAERLGVNLRTAEGHRATLMRKMAFGSLADLVRYAVRNRIIDL